MKRFVGVNYIVLFGEMEVVEVVCLEKRLNFTIFVLLCASVLVAIGLDDRAVALILAQ